MYVNSIFVGIPKFLTLLVCQQARQDTAMLKVKKIVVT